MLEDLIPVLSDLPDPILEPAEGFPARESYDHPDIVFLSVESLRGADTGFAKRKSSVGALYDTF